MPGYYDLVLGAIPSTLVGVSGGLHLAGVELVTAVPLAGLLAVAIMGHAMFINGPTEAIPGDTPPQSSQPGATGRIRAAD